MKKALKITGIIILSALVLAVIIPLIVPLPQPANLSSVEALKDPDSRFMTIQGLKVHYKQAGTGSPALVLLHGFGASTFSWREILQPLSKLGTVVAYDRPAFGLTDRPMPGTWTGSSPYSLTAQADMLIALLDAQKIDQAILIGNSAGGTVSVYTALKYPQRVKGLVLIDAAIYNGSGLPQWLIPLLATPQGRWYGPLFARQIQESGMNLLITAWHDPAQVTPEIIAGYRKPLQIPNWDRALWELTLAQEPPNLAAHLSEIKIPTLVLTGDDDRIVPTGQSLRLAKEIPGAQLAVIQACGHVPQEECPDQVLPVMIEFIKSIP